MFNPRSIQHNDHLINWVSIKMVSLGKQEEVKFYEESGRDMWVCSPSRYYNISQLSRVFRLQCHNVVLALLTVRNEKSCLSYVLLL